MKHIPPLETRSAEPIEIRNDDEPDIGAAIAAVTELRTAVEQNRTALDTRLTTEMRGLTERLDAIDVRTQRPGGTATAPNAQAELEQRAFNGFIRRGRESLSADEVRMLRVADDTAGGFLAPTQFIDEIIRNLVLMSPVRAAARVGSMSASALRIPKRTGVLSVNWTGEIEPRTPSQPAYGEIELTAHEMGTHVDVSNQLLEDSAFDIVSELSFDFAEIFAQKEGSAFIAGDGIKKPVGLINDPTIPSLVSGLSTALDVDNFIDTIYSLPAFYRANAVWMMAATTIGTLRKYKDGQGRFLWQQNLMAGQPDTFCGFPIVECPDMDPIAAGATPVIFGDVRSAFRIYDRVGFSVLRDPYTLAVVGQTRFHARRRLAAGVVKGEALRKLRVSAT